MITIIKKAHITGDINVYDIVNVKHQISIEAIMNESELKDIRQQLRAEDFDVNMDEIVRLTKSQEDLFYQNL